MKHYEEYARLRQHIDSNQAVTMLRLQAMHDTVMELQYANNQQTNLLRKQVRRLTHAVYIVVALMFLGIAYLLFEDMKKKKEKKNARDISYNRLAETGLEMQQ